MSGALWRSLGLPSALSAQVLGIWVLGLRRCGAQYPTPNTFLGNDIPLAAHASLPLTTTRQMHREKGLLAGRALVALLRGEAVAEHTILPVQLIVHGSTGEARHG
jgi:hypothetical protein